MPIDPSIPLGVRPATFNLGEMFSAMGNMQQARIGSLKLQEAERQERDFRAINAALQRAPRDVRGVPNYDAVAQQLESEGFGSAGQSVRQQAAAIEKARSEALTAQFDTRIKQADVLDANLGVATILLERAKDEPSYASARSTIGRMFGQEIVDSLLPEAYDPASVEQLKALGQGTKQGIERRRTALLEMAQAISGKKEIRDAQSFWTKEFGNYVSTLGTPEARAKAFQEAQSIGVPESVLRMFPAPDDPQFETRVQGLTIDAGKRAELAGQAEARGETARHNKVAEGIARGSLGVAQEGLKLRAEEIGIARKALAQREIDPTQMGPVADMVMRDPEVLKNFTATEKGKIMRYIATEEGGAMPNRRAESLLEIAGLARQTLDDLTSHPGLSDAVGYKGPIAAFFGPISGTPAAGFVAKFDTLKSRLTLPRLEMMRGLGAMSEKEFKALSDAASSLSRDMGEKEFRDEIGVIGKTLTAVEQRLQGQIATRRAPGAGMSVTPGGGLPVQLIDPNGIPRTVPSDMVDEFLRRGGRRP